MQDAIPRTFFTCTFQRSPGIRTVPLLPFASFCTVRVKLFKTLDILRFLPTCLFPACSDSYHVAMVYHSQVSQKLLSFDPERLGNRGPRRYSFGGASKTLHMMSLAEEGRMSPHPHTPWVHVCTTYLLTNYNIFVVFTKMLLH